MADGMAVGLTPQVQLNKGLVNFDDSAHAKHHVKPSGGASKVPEDWDGTLLEREAIASVKDECRVDMRNQPGFACSKYNYKHVPRLPGGLWAGQGL